MIPFYDYDGEEIEYVEWMDLFWHTDRHVAATAINDEVHVSTVWMGIHMWSPDEAPLIYESMILGGPDNGVGIRTPNRAAALAAHDQLVAHQREMRKT